MKGGFTLTQMATAADATAAAKTPKAGAVRNDISSDALLEHILSSLNKDKAEDVVQIDLRGRTAMADHMVICSGRSTRQVSALAEKLTDELKQDFGILSKIEGKDQGDWVLIDTGDVIVHIFRPEVREFYQLEKMWLPGGATTAEA